MSLSSLGIICSLLGLIKVLWHFFLVICFIISNFLFAYIINRHAFIWKFFSSKISSFNKCIIILHCFTDKDSILETRNNALYRHLTALYKNDVNSSSEVSSLHIRIHCAIGNFEVSDKYIFNISFSDLFPSTYKE